MIKIIKKVYLFLYQVEAFYTVAKLLWGNEFALRHLHPFQIIKHAFWQKVLRFNASARWPMHWSSRVTAANKIKPGSYGAGLNPGCILDGRNGIEIGNNVRIAPRVSIISANHSITDFDAYGTQPPIIIGDNSWLATNVVILPGVQLAEHTIVAAGSVVTKSFTEPDIIIGGVPARIIKKIPPYEGKPNRKIWERTFE